MSSSIDLERRLLLRGTLQELHFVSKRDQELADEFDRLLEGSSVTAFGRRIEGRALLLIGESGAGKTRAIRRIIEKLEQALTIETPAGPTLPIVSIIAPSPCTLRLLAMELLRETGYPIERELRENEAWHLLRRQLALRQVRVIHIDEAQHASGAMNRVERQKLSDTFKNLMQQREAPVSLMLSGLPDLTEFVKADVQLSRRCRIVSFAPLAFPKDARGLRRFVNNVCVERAGLTPVGLDDDEFLARLCRAGEGQVGRVIEFCRQAAEEALYGNRTEICLNDFARAYAMITGCEPDANFFIAKDWDTLPGPNDPAPAMPQEPAQRRGRA